LQLYNSENKLHFNELMMILLTLYYTTTLRWSFTVLSH